MMIPTRYKSYLPKKKIQTNTTIPRIELTQDLFWKFLKKFNYTFYAL